jgi:hypothetical protein
MEGGVKIDTLRSVEKKGLGNYGLPLNTVLICAVVSEDGIYINFMFAPCINNIKPFTVQLMHSITLNR